MAQTVLVPTTRHELQRLGFQGFVRFAELSASDVPAAAGVYAVVRTHVTPPAFLEVSRGGHFKGRDPSVPVEVLRAAWVEGVETVYLGKATAGGGGRRGLRKRLDEYRRFGQGQPVGHWGGRYIWQLEDSGSLVVGWLETSPEDPGDVESRLIADFIAVTGARPFANRNRGRRPAPS